MSEEEVLEQQVPLPSPSRVLVAAREKLGLSQKEVADKLFLTTTFIKYIDEGQFQSIPKPAFVKGYLRSYARVVGLSGDDIVAFYEAELEAHEPAPEIKGVTEENVGSSAITGPVLQTGVIGLGGLLLLIALVWWATSDSDADAPPVVTQPQTALADEMVPVDSLTTDEIALEQISGTVAAGEPGIFEGSLETETNSAIAPAIATAVVGDADVLKDPETEPKTEPQTEPQTEQSANPADDASVDDDEAASRPPITIDRTSDGSRNFVTLDAGGFDQLELSFSDECWVEVRDAERGQIYNDLNREGDVLTVYGASPFELLLGKATAVEMIYNGRPFDLEPYISRDRTAKLTVVE